MGKQAWATRVFGRVAIDADIAVRGVVIGRCRSPAAVTGRPRDMRVSDPAQVELTPMPAINAAMTSAHAAFKAFAAAV
jgi:hypothetical protein